MIRKRGRDLQAQQSADTLPSYRKGRGLADRSGMNEQALAERADLGEGKHFQNRELPF